MATAAGKEHRASRKRASLGWGATAEQARSLARRKLIGGPLLGAVGIGMGLLFLLRPPLLQVPAGFGMTLVGIAFVLGGVYPIAFLSYEGRALWQYWQTWQHQTPATVVLEGTLRELGTLGAFVDDGERELIQFLQPDGTSQLLVVRSQFLDALPAESSRVRLEYQEGTERVLMLTALPESSKTGSESI